MKLALVLEGDDYGIFDDAARRAGNAKKLAMLNRNMADVSLLPTGGGGIEGLPTGSYHSLNAALIALKEAGFEYETYE